MAKMILVNDSMQMIMKDQSGNTLRSVIHFGAFKENREKLFKGAPSIEIEEADFDRLAAKYASPYYDHY